MYTSARITGTQGRLNAPYGAPRFLTGAEASGHHDMAVQVLMHLMALRAF